MKDFLEKLKDCVDWDFGIWDHCGLVEKKKKKKSLIIPSDSSTKHKNHF